MADNQKTPKASSKPEKETKKADKKAAEAGTGKKMLGSVKQFFKDVKGETKKIVWNSKEDTIKNTGVVLAVTAVVGAGVWIADVVFGALKDLAFGGEAAMIMLQGLTNLL